MRGKGGHEVSVKDERDRDSSSQTNHSYGQRKPGNRRCQLLPAGDAAHVGQMVGDALVAVDAGLLADEQEARDGSAGRLLCDVHRLRAVAVAAFQRIIGLEARPLVQRQFQALVEEFFARVDVSEQMTPNLLRESSP
jgi:hypothetical protein